MYNEEFSYISRCIAVSNRHLCQGDFLEQTEKVCAMHPAAYLLREKDLSVSEYDALAVKVLQITKEYHVKCILHSYSEVALALNHPHLHLPLGKLIEMKEEQKKYFHTLGASVHSVEEAKRAAGAGAGYLTAGHIYATSCKPDLPPRGLEFLQNVCDSAGVPVYAIGGIQFEDKQWDELFSRHAAGGCIMSGFMQMK